MARTLLRALATRASLLRGAPHRATPPARGLRSGPGGLLHGYKNADVDASTAVRFTFINRDGAEMTVAAPRGRSLLEVAHANDIELEGACEGSLACSTCHVYLDDDSFAKLEEPCDDENDMLDLAFALSEKYVRITRHTRDAEFGSGC